MHILRNPPAWMPQWIRPFAFEVGDYQPKQSTAETHCCHYVIADPQMEPRMPYFSGFRPCADDDSHSFLFISANVPEKLRTAWFEHELFCLSSEHINEPDGCEAAVRCEMRFVNESDLTLYKQLRLQFFEDLVAFLWAHDSKNPLIPRATKARDLIQTVWYA